MREIKCRGKSKIDGSWVYGSYVDGFIINGVAEANDEYIAIEEWTPVVRGTIGESTGLKDRNSKKIYEGDILDCSYINPMTGKKIEKYCVIEFEKGNYIAKKIDSSPYGDMWLRFEHDNGIIIGNIYDNKELLKEV